MMLSSRLTGSEDGDGDCCTCPHPDDATTIAHSKSKLHERNLPSCAVYSNSGGFDSHLTNMALALDFF
jgi:hypothetical protein